MAQATRDISLDLESHRRQLQDTLHNQTKSLRHWQLWEAEYEGLKEEILSNTVSLTREKLVTNCNQYDGELLSKSDINDILGTNIARDGVQVISLIDRRIDYVERNISTIQKQINVTEEKLAATNNISSPEFLNEEVLPLTEITETLDDQGNIISSQLSTPRSVNPQLLDVLHKASVNKLSSVLDEPPSTNSDKRKSIKKESDSITPSRKFVSFADDVKSDPEVRIPYTDTGNMETLNGVQHPQISSYEHSIPPSDDSPEDAALRREMLEYAMLDVGSVVAELEIESGSDWSDDHSEEEASSSSDEEDSFGRYTGQIITDDYRKHMVELENRIGNQMEDIDDNAGNLSIIEEGIGGITVQEEKIKDTKPKKKVRFSKYLGPPPSTDLKSLTSSGIEKVKLSRPASGSSIAHEHVEHEVKDCLQQAKKPPLEGLTTIAEKTGSKLSRSPSVISREKNATPLSETVIERETPANYPLAEPYEIDSHLLRQEVATEYYKMRNLMIQRQGGFMRENESVRVEFTEEEGGPKKMSRFKAARLAKS